MKERAGRLHNAIQGLFIDRHCIRKVMDVFYFGPRDPFLPRGKEEKEDSRRKRGRIKQGGIKPSRGCEGEKVERNAEAEVMDRSGPITSFVSICAEYCS